ncbi:hypothetical protein PF011_g7439 [Phytophthora fragariae]|uniref:Helicase-associated domain-containing protein n=1 Tax=Phytophthora fragariae TaxID=53985 RepID=A0A6A3LAZ2_9STRA|nr:hypothetical protein PF011_g7439 [Phytophthora fragariae]
MEEELEKLDFVYDVYQFRWDRIVLPALQEFYRVHGHTDVPESFVVPSGDEAWPKLTWGYRLGNIVGIIRRREVYSTQVAMSKEELDRMAFAMTFQPLNAAAAAVGKVVGPLQPDRCSKS